VRRGAPDESAIVISQDLSIPLGVLKQHALRTARGQKIAYVVDAAYHDRNVEKIIALACDLGPKLVRLGSFADLGPL
jgi:hypothetical protein